MANSSSKSIATKADIDRLDKKMATKTELKKVEKNLRGEILRVEEKVERVEERVERVEERVERVEDGVQTLQEGQKSIKITLTRLQDTLDGFIGKIDNLTTENVVGADQIQRLNESAKDHERRLKKLESSSVQYQK